eukprot:12919672-Prorocentrum_lima.AAC.1
MASVIALPPNPPFLGPRFFVTVRGVKLKGDAFGFLLHGDYVGAVVCALPKFRPTFLRILRVGILTAAAVIGGILVR